MFQENPKKQKPIKFYYIEWFDERVKTAISERDNSYKNYKANKTEKNREIYLKHRNGY